MTILLIAVAGFLTYRLYVRIKERRVIDRRINQIAKGFNHDTRKGLSTL